MPVAILKTSQAQRAASPSAERVIPVVASTSAIDSEGDVVDQGSWRLDRFLRNPVACYQHATSADPIGFYRNVRVEADALRADLVLYDDEVSPDAGRIWRRYQAGGPICFSVGFWPGTESTEERDGRTVRVLRDCELSEISVVTIPANPDAVASAAKAAFLTRPRRARAGKGHNGNGARAMNLEEMMNSKGMTAETLAAAAGITPEQMAAALKGEGEPEVMAALGKALEVEFEEEPPAADPAAPAVEESADKAAAQALCKELGVTSLAEALIKTKALKQLSEEGRELATRVATLEKSTQATEREKVLADARRRGVLTPAREKKAGAFLAGLKTVGELKSYLDTLDPATPATPPAREPAAEAATSALSAEDLAVISREAGLSTESVRKAADHVAKKVVLR